KTEAFLTSRNYVWRYEVAHPLDQISGWREGENVGRLLRGVDHDRVLDYAVAMEQGAQFPAVVVFDTTPKHELATGRRRLRAADLQQGTVFPAYVVTESDSYRRDVLRRQLNTIEGVGETRQEMIQQIIALKESWSDVSLKDLVAGWPVSLQAVKNAHHAHR